MKLRIYCNSLRFRLSPGDVAQLRQTGRITESTDFGSDVQFKYSIEFGRASVMRAQLESNHVLLEIPTSQGEEWAVGQSVGLRCVQELALGKSLEILVEKDFECLEAQMNEPGVELYPNPNKACVR